MAEKPVAALRPFINRCGTRLRQPLQKTDCAVYFLYLFDIQEAAGVDFEFDESKSAADKGKHGIDFTEAQALWLDERRIEIPARTEDEPRFLMIGTIADRHWSAVITYRGDRVRVISVRRSRPEEVAIYEG